ncbi:uncharacterized protein LOC131878243 isoform X4 [Tigriopus californicus]|uniref:uncharacterized protein LOC131878243 isoform X4 n=1 Tax=Tigriopus californicus TaxID=6832 RepID=UPI0027DA3684|nr:uncharacterized protein LOC131878243 isoform X4 [Tigriopus californicus]
MESPTLPQLSSALAQALQHSNHLNGEITTTDVYEPEFGQHVSRLRGTMFYVCQGSCLCGTVNNRGKVIYCYGDLVPRQGELFAEGTESNGSTTSKDLLAALLGAWIVGILALLIVLLLIRKSIVSVKHHLEKVSDRLPVYHDDDLLSQNSTTSPGPGHVKDTTLDSVTRTGRNTPTATPSSTTIRPSAPFLTNNHEPPTKFRNSSNVNQAQFSSPRSGTFWNKFRQRIRETLL